ncbi:class I SAM-dependent methyltransferase [Corynebacterium sp. 153RC1]|uniref:class I SAM-dependent methyltransferase n=1 Tax=unclassified Corynebacterium TaxID=2624378 RepID=UPI00211CA7EC|nr:MULTISPECIES: class I SAM-dependent methyltransferase [unclassified Corynebacterium]MCQ9370850.1 class I SAM-dependent methyltransferase [Corynebacterium sp. 35RC1]MCQ9352679.1 class I SAM-dependent methyltransferase [Corynebacterium sp. 209RC1]MCQ9354863.1 class I SAM-dependent methyltransferase [Corynebacterium sp. 1222RC1]MCQ9357048.1 class I SAM-dependent methyltransferase [Corynebacterium sp. 122RC1]MCQ9359294.1 class I SAM-dependent methyltransferase [Corynebacterium sp. 142RC1]
MSAASHPVPPTARRNARTTARPTARTTASFPRTAAFATLRRSLRLLTSFRHEQRSPDEFYRPLAADTAAQIHAIAADLGTQVGKVLDVGGGPGYFAAEFADYISLEPDAGEMQAAGISLSNAVRGTGEALPFADASFDTVFSSNVAEHVPDPWLMAQEMLRVCKPGGLVILSYTVWLGPFGGHETGLWQHYLGGEFARRRYVARHGHEPKNVWGTSLFAVSCKEGLRWARQHDAVLCIPRYHPRWAWWVVRVPLLREFLVSNLLIVVRAPGR